MRLFLSLFISMTWCAAVASAQSAGSIAAGTEASVDTSGAEAAASAEAGSTTAPGQDSVAAAPGGEAPLAVRDLDERVNRLKDNVYRLKAKLALLAEAVMEGAISGSRGIITFENEMSAGYVLTRLALSIDGRTVFDRTDASGSLGRNPSFEVFNGNLEPGEHAISVIIEYAGRGHGVFAYVDKYTFKVRSAHTVDVPEGKALHLRVVGFERGKPKLAMEDRPSVRFAERLSTLRNVELAAADGPRS